MPSKVIIKSIGGKPPVITKSGGRTHYTSAKSSKSSSSKSSSSSNVTKKGATTTTKKTNPDGSVSTVVAIKKDGKTIFTEYKDGQQVDILGNVVGGNKTSNIKKGGKTDKAPAGGTVMKEEEIIQDGKVMIKKTHSGGGYSVEPKVIGGSASDKSTYNYNKDGTITREYTTPQGAVIKETQSPKKSGGYNVVSEKYLNGKLATTQKSSTQPERVKIKSFTDSSTGIKYQPMEASIKTSSGKIYDSIIKSDKLYPTLGPTTVTATSNQPVFSGQKQEENIQEPTLTLNSEDPQLNADATKIAMFNSKVDNYVTGNIFGRDPNKKKQLDIEREQLIFELKKKYPDSNPEAVLSDTGNTAMVTNVSYANNDSIIGKLFESSEESIPQGQILQTIGGKQKTDDEKIKTLIGYDIPPGPSEEGMYVGPGLLAGISSVRPIESKEKQPTASMYMTGLQQELDPNFQGEVDLPRADGLTDTDYLRMDLVRSSYDDSLDKIQAEAKEMKGDGSGKVWFNTDKRDVLLSSLIYQSEDIDKKFLTEADETVLIPSAQEDKITDDKYSDYQLSTGQTVQDVLSVPATRNLYLGEYKKLVGTDVDPNLALSGTTDNLLNSVTNTQLAPIVIGTDYNAELSKKLQDLEDSSTGEYKWIQNPDGTHSQQYFSTSDAEQQQAEKIINDYYKNFDEFQKELDIDFASYGLDEEERHQIAVIDDKRLAARQEANRVLQDIKEIDFSYNRDIQYDDKIADNRFSSDNFWTKPSNYLLSPVALGLKIANKQITTDSILSTPNTIKLKLEKNIGGLVAKGVQGGGNLLTDSFRTDDIVTGDYRKSLLNRYNISTPETKLTNLGVQGTVVTAGTMLAGPAFPYWYMSGQVGAVTGKTVFEDIAYEKAGEKEKQYMQNYSNLTKSMRSGWSRENQKIASGWWSDNDKYDSQGNFVSGGWDGTARNFLTMIPGSGFIGVLGDQRGFIEGAEEYYRGQGLTGDDLYYATLASVRQRRAGIAGEAAGILAGNIGSELVGRHALSSAVSRGLKGNFATGFKTIGSAGIIEGQMIEQARQEKEYEDTDWGKIGTAQGIGFVTAGTIGGLMAQSGAGGKVNKFLTGFGYLTDWYEKPGDLLADALANAIPGVGKYAGKVHSKTFTLTVINAFSKSGEKANVNIKDIKNVKTVSGGTEITLNNGKKLSLKNTPANSQVLINMKSYVDNQLSGITSKTTAPTQGQATLTSFTQTPTYSKAEPFAFPEVYSQSKIESIIGVQPEVFPEPQIQTLPEALTITQIQAQPEVIIKSQTFTQSNVFPNILPQSQTQASVLTKTGLGAAIPIGGLPRGNTRFSFGPYSESWVVSNKIADYAGEWGRRKGFDTNGTSKQSNLFSLGSLGQSTELTQKPLFGETISTDDKLAKYLGNKRNTKQKKFIFNTANKLKSFGFGKVNIKGLI